MKGLWCLGTTVVLLVASAALAGATSIEKILEYRSLSDVRVSPDGRWGVFVATFSDTEENTMNSDLWVVDLESGRSYQLTRGPKRDSEPKWSPDGKKIAFLSNRSGKTNIWLIHPDGGEAWPATEFEKLSVSDFEWLPDGSGFLFTAPDLPTPEEEKRKKEKRDVILVDQEFDYGRLYRFRLSEAEPEKLTEEDTHVNSFDVSPDGRWVAYGVQPTPKVPDFFRSDLRLLDLETGESRDLVKLSGLDMGPKFSPDGEWLAFISSTPEDAWIGNTYLHVVRPDGTGLRNVSRAFDERFGGFGGAMEWSADGQWVYFTGGQGAPVRLFRIRVDTGQYQPVSAHDQKRTVHAFDVEAQGRFALLALSDPETPAEIYRLGLETNELEQLTSVNEAFAGTAPQTELMRYRSNDGLDLEGLVVKPRDFQEGKRYPLLVVIHGGPAGVFTWSFTPRRGAYPIHAFTEQGYLVFMPNPRGSGGYGERFRRANVQDWGYGDYRDILQGVDLLIRRGLADRERMGVMGWSYGGYMTSWIVSQTDRFQAASMGAGLSNLVSMYGTTDIPEFPEAYFGGPPWEDMERYLRHSAIYYVSRAKTPTLIQHGQADRRVPLSQGEEFYRALKAVGVEVEMVIYPRQPHGVREPRLQQDVLERNLNWFNHWLLGIEPPAEDETSDTGEESNPQLQGTGGVE
ncbi:S9 family peptidase [Acidobacteriia bacterium AH_259_A11_L15]|nr:S9 family peptidase [Acidobacteriia bacterium AH_259_A11_L15]